MVTTASTATPAPPPAGAGVTRTRLLDIRVHGIPAPQGSKRAIPMRNGRVNLVESSARVGPWRDEIAFRTRRAIRFDCGWATPGVFPLRVPVHVLATFYLPRPRGHYGTGRNAARIRPGAPVLPAGKPDLDKLVRAVLDGLTGVALADDSIVCSIEAAKAYADPEPYGVAITLQWDD